MIRLLNIYTMRICQFETTYIPPYAVASHRWQDNETTHEEFIQGHNLEQSGHKKIEGFCNFLRKDASVLENLLGHKLKWLWIDTCCIKKSDANELSEAINSMFDWYASADICFAYLVDVGKEESVVSSSWFDRGWTLQELLAPSLVVFLDRDWQIRGHKKDVAFSDDSLYRNFETNLEAYWLGPALTPALSSRTGITTDVLKGFDQLQFIALQDVLRWMQSRQTSRHEDQAYCLLGILDINMTLNYGEQEGAMIRLLEHVRTRHRARLDIDWYSKTSTVSQTTIQREIMLLDAHLTDLYKAREERRRQNRRRANAPKAWANSQQRQIDEVVEFSKAISEGRISSRKDTISLFSDLISSQCYRAIDTSRLELAKAQPFWNPMEDQNIAALWTQAMFPNTT